MAGNVCNTWAYDPADPATSATVRAQYTEQLGWAVDEGVDFVISETNDYLGEALIALEVTQELGLPAMVTLASTQPDTTRDGYDYVDGVPDPGRSRGHHRRAELRPGPGDHAAAAGADPGGRGLRRGGAAGAVPDEPGDADDGVAARATAWTACSRWRWSRSRAPGSTWPPSRRRPATWA